MNNEFDITKVRFRDYLQGVKEGCEGYVADTMSDLYEFVVHNNQAYYKKIVKLDGNWKAPFVCDNGLVYLYFYLVKEPKEKVYRPFTWEEREQLRGKWLKEKGDGNADEELINDFYISNDGLFVINDKTAEHLLNYYVWLDGSPCGVPVEYDEIVQRRQDCIEK